jgi:hypothetical protein
MSVMGGTERCASPVFAAEPLTIDRHDGRRDQARACKSGGVRRVLVKRIQVEVPVLLR